MKSRIFHTIGIPVMLTLLLSLTSGSTFAAGGAPMTPQLAAKKENFRKQQAQRVTPEKRKAAAAALKAERLKVYQARQAAQQSTPVTTDNK
jgi:hypothetical protein